jgi:hypothetical protein
MPTPSKRSSGGSGPRCTGPHPYLRAYLAGIAVPTAFLLVVLAALLVAHSGGGHVAVERLLVFPMAVVPNPWGLWNMLGADYERRRCPGGCPA